jgi:hypothetical protein
MMRTSLSSSTSSTVFSFFAGAGGQRHMRRLVARLGTDPRQADGDGGAALGGAVDRDVTAGLPSRSANNLTMPNRPERPCPMRPIECVSGKPCPSGRSNFNDRRQFRFQVPPQHPAAESILALMHVPRKGTPPNGPLQRCLFHIDVLSIRLWTTRKIAIARNQLGISTSSRDAKAQSIL